MTNTHWIALPVGIKVTGSSNYELKALRSKRQRTGVRTPVCIRRQKLPEPLIEITGRLGELTGATGNESTAGPSLLAPNQRDNHEKSPPATDAQEPESKPSLPRDA